MDDIKPTHRFFIETSAMLTHNFLFETPEVLTPDNFEGFYEPSPANPYGASNLPSLYQECSWRNTTRVDSKSKLIGFGLTLKDKKRFYSMTIEDAHQLVETLTESIERHESGVPVENKSLFRNPSRLQLIANPEKLKYEHVDEALDEVSSDPIDRKEG